MKYPAKLIILNIGILCVVTVLAIIFSNTGLISMPPSWLLMATATGVVLASSMSRSKEGKILKGRYMAGFLLGAIFCAVFYSCVPISGQY